MRLRRRRNPPKGGPNYFGVRTRLAQSSGTNKRYKLGEIRVLPTRKKDTVVLQATDGQQAVCLITLGTMSRVRLVPADILPSRKNTEPVVVDVLNGQWQSSDGKTISDTYADDTSYPPFADVLPKFGYKDKAPPIRLGIDLVLLNKVADALGTSKLTLLLPDTDKTPAPGAPGEGYVSQPVAVCPATDEGKVRGVGVVMPLKPVNGASFYTKVRRIVVDAEARCKPRASIRTIKRAK